MYGKRLLFASDTAAVLATASFENRFQGATAVTLSGGARSTSESDYHDAPKAGGATSQRKGVCSIRFDSMVKYPPQARKEVPTPHTHGPQPICPYLVLFLLELLHALVGDADRVSLGVAPVERTLHVTSPPHQGRVI